MERILSIVLVIALTLTFCFIIPASGKTAYADEQSYAFLRTPALSGGPDNVTFHVPSGKQLSAVTLDGATVPQGDGTTPWESGFISAEKNYTYNPANGEFTISRRYIAVDLDLYGSRHLDFDLEFSDGTTSTVRLNAVYNWHPNTVKPAKATAANVFGYHNDELTPTSDWAMTCDSVVNSSPLNGIDGLESELHSYYYHDGSSFHFRNKVPFYYDFDFGKETQISGVRYYPRLSNTTGSFQHTEFYGSNDGETYTLITSDTYAGGKDPVATTFSENASYRYFRVRVVTSVSKYSVAADIHFLKPALTPETRDIDLAGSYDRSFDLDGHAETVIGVSENDAAIPSGTYDLSDHVFTFDDGFIRSLPLGEHNFLVSFDDSYLSIKLNVTDSARILSETKENAVNELKTVSDADTSSYEAAILAAESVDAVYTALDAAEEELGAVTLELPYHQIRTFTGGTLLYQFVSFDGDLVGDTAVLSKNGDDFTAVGLGRAIVTSGGTRYLIKATKSPLALVLVTGQSNAAGDSSDQSMTPSAVGPYKNRYLVTNSMNCSLPLANVTYNDAVYTAEHAGASQYASGSWLTWSAAEASQLGARLSDKWDMPVWVVNTGVCAQVIEQFDPKNETHTTYTATVNYMTKVRELIEENPHYVLDESKTGMFWLQGESDGIGRGAEENTMADYTERFLNMYEGFKQEFSVNYCGIWLVRAGVNSNGNIDFYMSGPRLSQIYTGNATDGLCREIYLILNTDIWRTNEGVSTYFSEKYPDAAAFSSYYGYTRPSTYAEIKPGLHHSQKGYNELGDEAGCNIAKILSDNKDPVTSAELYDYYGKPVASTGFSLVAGSSTNGSALAVPYVSNCDYNASYGLTVEIDDTDIAEYDPDSFTIKAKAIGKTTAHLVAGSKRLASYPVSVPKAVADDKTLTDRSKWTITASSTNGSSVAANLLDGALSTYWIADLAAKDLPYTIDVTLPATATVSGITLGTYSDNNGFPLSYEVYGSTSADGDFTKLYSGTFTQASFVKNSEFTIPFGFNIDLRRIRFVITNAVNKYGALSEFSLNGKDDGKPMYTMDSLVLADRSKWSITASSTNGSSVAANLLDGNLTTYWIADLVAKDLPYSLEITLPALASVSGITLGTYADNNGFPLSYEVYGSPSDTDEYMQLFAGTYTITDFVKNSEFKIPFGFNIELKRLKFVIKNSVNKYGALSEFSLNAKDTAKPDYTFDSLILADRSKWTITASSTNGGSVAKNLLDNNLTTYWIANLAAKDIPYTLEVTLPGAASVSGIILGTYSDNNGFPLSYSIYTSASNTDEYTLLQSGAYTLSDFVKNSEFTIPFNKNVTLQRIKFVINNAVNKYGALSEFNLIPPKPHITGDINDDGAINAKDITQLRRAIAGGYGVTLPASYMDLNYDGAANGKDITLLRRYIVGGYGVTLEPKEDPVDPPEEPELTSYTVTKDNVRLLGRNYTQDSTLWSSFTDSGIEFSFNGTYAKAIVNVTGSYDAYLHVFVDGDEALYTDYSLDTRLLVAKGNNREVVLCRDLEPGVHTVKVIKANEDDYNHVGWKSLALDGDLLSMPTAKSRKIQVFGDSITCAYSNMNFPENTSDLGGAKYEDGAMSYAAYIARHFDSDLEIFACSGLSVYTVFQGSVVNPSYNTVSIRNPSLGAWDHSQSHPDLILTFNWINEYHGKIVRDGVPTADIEAAYVRMLTTMRNAHPNAKIIIMSNKSVPVFSEVARNAIAAYGLAGGRTSDITIFESGISYPKHPFAAQDVLIANEINPFIADFMGWN